LDHFIYLSCYRKKGAKEKSAGEKVVVDFFRVSGPFNYFWRISLSGILHPDFMFPSP
jgi:hypothetical protein